jgi:hypothetical protein
MGKAYFELSTVLLRDALCLPNDVEVVRVEQSEYEADRGIMRVIVSGDGLPDGGNGDLIRPAFRQVTQRVVEFVGWE